MLRKLAEIEDGDVSASHRLDAIRDTLEGLLQHSSEKSRSISEKGVENLDDTDVQPEIREETLPLLNSGAIDTFDGTDSKNADRARETHWEEGQRRDVPSDQNVGADVTEKADMSIESESAGLSPLTAARTDSPSVCSDDNFVPLVPAPAETVVAGENGRSVSMCSMPRLTPSSEQPAPLDVGPPPGITSEKVDGAMLVKLNNGSRSAPSTDDYGTESSVCSDDDDFIALDPAPSESREQNDGSFWKSSVAEHVKSNTDVMSNCKDRPFDDQQEEENHNLLAKVGGSLAIFGAVVGGVALAAAINGGDEKTSQNSETKRRTPS